MYERDRGRILYYWRRYDEAIVQLTREMDLMPDAVNGIWLSRAYEMKGNYGAAFEAFLKTQKDPQRLEAFHTAFETAGWQGVQRKFLEYSILDEQKDGANNYKIAITFAQLGEEAGVRIFDKLVEERSWQITMLHVDPQLDSLRAIRASMNCFGSSTKLIRAGKINSNWNVNHMKGPFKETMNTRKAMSWF